MRSVKAASTRQVFGVILLVAVALAWVLSRGPDDLFYQPEVQQPFEPDYTLTDFTVTLMGAQGSPAYRLSAQAMQHYPGKGLAQWRQPLIIVYQEGEAVWQIQAQQAQSPDEGEYVQLEGDVRLQRLGDAGGANEILAQDMLVLTDRNMVTTENPVTIHHQGGVTEGVGLRADLDKRQLKLLSQVRGVYDNVAR